MSKHYSSWALTLVALFVLGCGDSDDKSSSSSEPDKSTEKIEGENAADKQNGDQDQAFQKTHAVPEFYTKYLTEDFVFAVAARPAKLLGTKLLTPLPIEKPLADMIHETGIDLRKVEQVVVYATGFPGGTKTGVRAEDGTLLERKGSPDPDFGGVAKFTEKVDESLLNDMFNFPTTEKAEHEGVAYIRVMFPKKEKPKKDEDVPFDEKTKEKDADAADKDTALEDEEPPLEPGPCFLFLDDTVVFASNDAVLKKMISAGGAKSELAALLTRADLSRDLVVAGAFRSKQDQIREFVAGPGAPPPLAALAVAQDIVVSVDLSDEVLLSVSIQGDDDAADKLLIAVQAGKKLLQVALFAGSDKIEKLTGKATVKALQNVLAGLKISREERWIHLTFNRPSGLEDVVNELAEQMKRSMERTQRANMLKNLVAAIFSYESQHGHIPAQAIKSKDGKPLLSWRVEILPAAGFPDLYDQFKLDEPWDSDHNKKLIEKMPSTFFATPGSEAAGKTRYLAVVGPKTVFGADKPILLSGKNIPDGLFRTVLLVEVGPDKAVIWTKPEDLQHDEANPIAALGAIEDGSFWTGYCDGHSKLLPKDIPAAQLNALFSRNGAD